MEQGLDESQLAQLSDALDELHRERHLWTAINEEAVHVLDELKRRGLRLAVISNSEDGRVAELYRRSTFFIALIYASIHTLWNMPNRMRAFFSTPSIN
jgi:FMN phosphatase YigB (HAD superfamily)